MRFAYWTALIAVSGMSLATTFPTTPAPLPVLAHLTMHSHRAGWAITSQGQIVHTVNGGTRWTPVLTIPGGVHPTSVAFPTTNLAMITTAQPAKSLIVQQTTNAGFSWETSVLPIRSNTATVMASAWVIPQKIAWIATQTPNSIQLWRKTPSGPWKKMWHGIDMMGSTTVLGFGFASDKTGWVTGINAALGRPFFMRTQNDGRGWSNAVSTLQWLPNQRPTTNATVIVNPPHFWTTRTGWLDILVSRSHHNTWALFTTQNGGTSWQEVTTLSLGSNPMVPSVSFPNPAFGVLATSDHDVWTFRLSKTERVARQKAIPQHLPWTRISSFTFTSSTTGWALVETQQGQRLEYTMNGGNTWHREEFTVLADRG